MKGEDGESQSDIMKPTKRPKRVAAMEACRKMQLKDEAAMIDTSMVKETPKPTKKRKSRGSSKNRTKPKEQNSRGIDATSIEGEKQKSVLLNKYQKAVPHDVQFPMEIFRSILEFSPERSVHNAIAGSSKELLALTHQVDTCWPTVELNPPAEEMDFCSGWSTRVIFSEDSQQFFVFHKGQVKETWDARTGFSAEDILDYDNDQYYRNTIFSPDGKYRVAFHRDGGNIFVRGQESTWGRGRWQTHAQWRLHRTEKPFVSFGWGTHGFCIMAITFSNISFLVDLGSRRPLFSTHETNFIPRRHKQTVPILCNRRFMLWQDLNNTIVVVIHQGADTENFGPRPQVSMILPPLDSFIAHPKDDSLVVAARAQVLGDGSHTISHEFYLIRLFWSSETEEERPSLGHIGSEVAGRKQLSTPEKVDMLLERSDLPRHMPRMFWFSDGKHLAYFFDRTFHLLLVDKDAPRDRLMEFDPDPKALPSILIEKANTFIRTQMSPLGCILWAQLSPNERSLVIRIKSDVESTCIVSI